MECIVCFVAWLDQSTYWEIGDATGEVERAKAAIASMMRFVVNFLPRQKSSRKQRGNGWKVSKLHEIYFIVRFIVARGGSRGYNASRPEEHHKVHAKRPGRRSLKNAKTIDPQCVMRIADTYIIDTYHELFQGDQPGGFTGNNIQDFGTGEGDKNEPRTVDEGSRTPLRDPKDDNQVLHKVGFHRQTKGPINLKQYIALFIL